MAANVHVPMSQGHPWARAHCRTARCPFSAAIEHVSSSQGHPWARAHWRTARFPFSAACANVHALQGHPWDEKTCSSAAENGHLAVLQAI